MRPTAATLIPAAAFAALLGIVSCSSSGAQAVRDVMQKPIAPASDAIFNAVVYANGALASAPQTDPQWARLREHAESLRLSAGTLRSLTPRTNPDVWETQTDALAAAAVDATKAIDGKSLDGVLDAGGKIYATCTGCHAVYLQTDEGRR